MKEKSIKDLGVSIGEDFLKNTPLPYFKLRETVSQMPTPLENQIKEAFYSKELNGLILILHRYYKPLIRKA